MTLLCFQLLFCVRYCLGEDLVLSHDNLADDTYDQKLGFDMLQALYLPCQQNERCRK